MPKRNHSHTHKICRQTGKKILADRVAAELLLEEIQLNSRREIHDEKRVYPCRFCKVRVGLELMPGWHLTSTDHKIPLSHSA